MAVAHNFSEKKRTSDVVIHENVDFAGLLLSKPVLNGLKNAGFEKPSPIQLKAIPLGRCGLDLIVQAKSGTGKTCVFSVVALEAIETTTASTQVLVLAPTREIALQIWEVVCSIGSAMSGLCCHPFIGGMPLHEDKKKLQRCHIAVGTPGRIQYLIQQGLLKTQSIRQFILDEADKLLEEGFQKQINWIYSSLPVNKQMLALSATYPEYLAEQLTVYMRNPTFVRLNITDPALLGIRQYYTTVPNHPLPHYEFESKMAAVIKLLSSISFNQCLIFSNYQTRAQNLQNELSYQGWPTTCIAGCLDQKDRITAITKLKTYSCRILISTDLSSRGIDADRVNLVINLDVPSHHETYLHRIGRAGRYGSYGAGVTITNDGQELADLHKIEHSVGTHITPLPDPIPMDLVRLPLPVQLEDVVSTQQIITRSDHRTISVTDNHHTGTQQTVMPAGITEQTTALSGANGHIDNQDLSSVEEGDTADKAVREGSISPQPLDRPGQTANGHSESLGGTAATGGLEHPDITGIEKDTYSHVPLENGSAHTAGGMTGASGCSFDSNADTEDSSVSSVKRPDSYEQVSECGREPSAVKKNGKGHAAGNLWASMLTDQQDMGQNPETEEVLSPLINGKKQGRTKQNTAKSGGKKEVSWDKELELYVAARSKLGSVSENDGDDGASLPDKPVGQATRVFKEAKRRKPEQPEAQNFQNGQAEVVTSKMESENHLPAHTPSLTITHAVVQKEGGRDEGRESASVSREESEPPLTMEPGRQGSQIPKTFGKPYLSKDPKAQSTFLARAEQLGLRDILLQQTVSYVPPPKISVSSEKQAKRNTSPKTYTSLVQNYKQYLKETYTPSEQTVATLARQTFSLPQTPDENQRQKLLQFLGCFYAKWDRTGPTSDLEMNGDDSGYQRQFRANIDADRVHKDENSSELDFVSRSKTVAVEESSEGKSGDDDVTVNSTESAVKAANTEPKSNAVDASGEDAGKEDQSVTKVKRKETTQRNRRPIRYCPLAVCGPATFHLLQPSDNIQDTASASGVTEAAHSEPTNAASSVGLSDQAAASGRTVPSRPEEQDNRLAGVSSLGKGAIPKRIPAKPSGEIPVSKGAISKQAHSKPASVPSGKGAISKQAASRSKKAQSSSEDSSDEEASSSSTSTVEEVELPKREDAEGDWMCIQNQYAVEASALGQGKKLGPRARTGRKGKEERLRLQAQLSSSQEDKSEKKRHGRRVKSGTDQEVNTAYPDQSAPVGGHNWYPYPSQSMHQNRTYLQNYHPFSFPAYPSNFCPPPPYPLKSSHSGHKTKKEKGKRDHGQAEHTQGYSSQYSQEAQNVAYLYPTLQQMMGYSYPPCTQGLMDPSSLSQQSSTYPFSSVGGQNPGYPTSQHPYHAWQQNAEYPYPTSQQNQRSPYPASHQNPGYLYPASQQNEGSPYPASQQNPGYPDPAWQRNFGYDYTAAQQNCASPYAQSQRTYSGSNKQQQQQAFMAGNYQQAPYHPWQNAVPNFNLPAGRSVSIQRLAQNQTHDQAVRVLNMQNYIRSMAKFYARFCTHNA